MPRDLQPFTAADAVLGIFIDHHADADDVILADLLAHLRQHFHAEAHAVFQRPAIGILAQVGAWRPETVKEMAIGFNLDPIEIAFLAASRGGAI